MLAISYRLTSLDVLDILRYSAAVIRQRLSDHIRAYTGNFGLAFGGDDPGDILSKVFALPAAVSDFERHHVGFALLIDFLLHFGDGVPRRLPSLEG